MKTDTNEIEVNGIKYVKKDSVNNQAVNTDGLEYCIVRTVHSGVHSGFLKFFEDDKCTLLESRRIWHWKGAATLSQLSQEGVKKPDLCKIPCEVGKIHLVGVIEVITATETAMESIRGVKVWQV